MEIILYQPDIPQNTGNIVRTCRATNCSLRLVRPLGFALSSRQVKRSGLDYWDEMDIREIDDLPQYLEKQKKPFFFYSSKVSRAYTEAEYTKDSILIFGSETKGLPPDYFESWPDHFYTIPMSEKARCLNLSNSAAIVVYEALRQQNFSPLLHSV